MGGYNTELTICSEIAFNCGIFSRITRSIIAKLTPS